jgi:hypothetical protein
LPWLQALARSALVIDPSGWVASFSRFVSGDGRPLGALAPNRIGTALPRCLLRWVRRLAVRSVLQVPLCSNVKDRPGGPGFVFAEPSFVAHGPHLAGQWPTSKKMKSAF